MSKRFALIGGALLSYCLSSRDPHVHEKKKKRRKEKQILRFDWSIIISLEAPYRVRNIDMIRTAIRKIRNTKFLEEASKVRRHVNVSEVWQGALRWLDESKSGASASVHAKSIDSSCK